MASLRLLLFLRWLLAIHAAGLEGLPDMTAVLVEFFSVQPNQGPITLRLRPVDNHAGDSPDFLLWVEVEFQLFGNDIRVAVPVPVEAEKGGITGGALK